MSEQRVGEAERAAFQRNNAMGTIEWKIALDLLDARAKIENVDREDRQARAEVMDLECVNGIKHCNPVRFRGECVYCAIEKAERELDEARKALVWAWNNASCSLAPAPDNVIAALNAARAVTEEQKR